MFTNVCSCMFTYVYPFLLVFTYILHCLIIDIRVEGLETASHERISGVTNRVCLTTATTRFPCSSLKNFVGLNLRSGSISWCIMILISCVWVCITGMCTLFCDQQLNLKYFTVLAVFRARCLWDCTSYAFIDIS